MKSQSKFKEAIADLDQALAINPGIPTSLVLRAELFYRIEEYDKAIADCETALKVEPKDIRALKTRALANAAQERFGDAIADLGSALAVNPKDLEALVDRARVCVQTRDYARAKKDLADAVIASPKYAAALGEQAVLAYLVGDEDPISLARNAFEAAKGDVDSAREAATIGYFAARRSDQPEEAKRFLDDADANDQGDATAQSVLKFLRGELDEAGYLAVQTNDTLRAEARCRIGLKLLLDENPYAAKAHFEWARDHASKLSRYRAIAIAELEKLAK